MYPQMPMMYPMQQPAPQRPWLSWAVAAAMALAAWYFSGGVIPPKLPPLPTRPPAQEQPQQPPAKPAADPVQAIARIQFDRAGCTAAPILPRRADGRYDVLTAAHCVPAVGARGLMFFKDGKRIGVSVVAMDKAADWCWLVTDEAQELPALTLAERSPEPGTPVWHAGYGIDKPANREDGTATATRTANGKQEFILSVSSGDSGGPILIRANEVVSCVCCTTERGSRVAMYGATTERIRAGRPSNVAQEWTPVEVPECRHGG